MWREREAPAQGVQRQKGVGCRLLGGVGKTGAILDGGQKSGQKAFHGQASRLGNPLSGLCRSRWTVSNMLQRPMLTLMGMPVQWKPWGKRTRFPHSRW